MKLNNLKAYEVSKSEHSSSGNPIKPITSIKYLLFAVWPNLRGPGNRLIFIAFLSFAEINFGKIYVCINFKNISHTSITISKLYLN